jgi:hypothetical protein
MVWDGQRGGFTDTMEANPEAEAMVLLNFHLLGGSFVMSKECLGKSYPPKKRGDSCIRQQSKTSRLIKDRE